MKIVIITQEDMFVIPANIQRLIEEPKVTIEEILITDIKGALTNRKFWFVQGFGFWQSAKMALLIFWTKIINLFDRVTRYKVMSKRRSILTVADKYLIPLRFIRDPNTLDTLNRLKEIAPDLIVSYSAPSVFKPALLSIPRFGCINLHCSLLPKYAGLLPSFWVLFKGENKTGATVHYMDDRIDNGKIIIQEVVSIDPSMSMYDVIRKTKTVGGQLMVKVVNSLQHGLLPTEPNNAEEGSYYSWPSIEEMKSFRKKGGRLI